MIQSLWEIVLTFVIKLNMHFPYDLTILLLDLYPRKKMQTYVYRKDLNECLQQLYP